LENEIVIYIFVSRYLKYGGNLELTSMVNYSEHVEAELTL